MKTIKKRTEITVKTSRLLVIGRHSGGFIAECDKCGKVVEMVVADEAAAIVRISSRVIYRAIEADDIHFIETPQIFVCLNSLLRFLDK